MVNVTAPSPNGTNGTGPQSGPRQTGTAFGRHTGLIYQARPGLAMLSATWPNLTNTLVVGRWLLWLWAGWPLLGTVVAVQMAYVIGSHWIVSAAVFGVSLLISLIPADMSRLVSNRGAVFAVWGPRLLTVALVGLTLATSSWTEVQVKTVVLVMAWVADRAIALVVPSYDLWRLWCHVRRKFPMVWFLMASTTSRVQGAGQGSESSISRGTNRSYLNHPAMNYIPEMNTTQFSVTGITSAPPGRDFEKYVVVLEELAAGYPVVAGIRLPGFGLSDTHSLIEFQFHRASWGRGGSRG